MTQPHRRASHIAEEGQLPQARNRRSASVTLDRVSESHDAEESDQVGQPPTRNKDDDELVAGEME